MNYMDKLLSDLRDDLHEYGEAACEQDDQRFLALEKKLLERVREELTRSFRNGLSKAREEPQRPVSRKSERREKRA